MAETVKCAMCDNYELFEELLENGDTAKEAFHKAVAKFALEVISEALEEGIRIGYEEGEQDGYDKGYSDACLDVVEIVTSYSQSVIETNE